LRNQLCEMLGVEFPLFAFSHCRDVVAAVSRAGGFGVLGANRFTPETLAMELSWLDAHLGGKPYGLDLAIPENIGVDPAISTADLQASVPAEHRAFLATLLKRYGIEADVDALISKQRPATLPDVGDGFWRSPSATPSG
jgi:NAD(P)H-dependent flavin oxidoreductase YrpB (nitropropane dioxygenase family)